MPSKVTKLVGSSHSLLVSLFTNHTPFSEAMRFSSLALAAFSLGLAVASPVEKRVARFKWAGVSQSGAEFGSGNYPGVLGTDYTWPDPIAVSTLLGQGFNAFRIAFAMERLTPNVLTGPFDSAYLSGLTTIVNQITHNGGYAIIDPHNYGRFYNNIIESTDDFQTWWTNVATLFKSNPKVVRRRLIPSHGLDSSR